MVLNAAMANERIIWNNVDGYHSATWPRPSNYFTDEIFPDFFLGGGGGGEGATL
jgi:hypothetical protein